eukprot:1287681-Prymnesium_polylepis.1
MARALGVMRGRAGGHGGRANEYDAWLQRYLAEFNMASVGEVEATYVAGGGGARSAIDHWLVDAAMYERAEAVVGGGADG